MTCGPPPGTFECEVTSFRAEVSLGRIGPELGRAYPASIANRIDPRLRYDVLFVDEAGGAVALESDAGLLPAVHSAVERAGLTCGESIRSVPAAELPGRVASIVSVNPTGGEIARLLRREAGKAWTGKSIHEISKRDVVEVIAAIEQRGAPVAANKTLKSIKTFLRWCVGRAVLDQSSAEGVPMPAKEVARDRVLAVRNSPV